MEYRQLGNSGLTVSGIGLGSVTFGREIDEETSFKVADRVFEQGITLFDTADAYSEGASEIILGKWIRDRQLHDKIVLMTKVGGPVTSDQKDRGCSQRYICEALDGSLRRLQVDCIDLYLLHCWDPDVPPPSTVNT